MTRKYLYTYDDPYVILAHAIVGFYRPSEVVRVLTDDGFLSNCVLKEIKEADIGGLFLDCIIEDILAHKKRMEYMGHLELLGQYYFSQLDKKRLRDAILEVLSDMGVSLNYSTDGSVLLANTTESPVLSRTSL